MLHFVWAELKSNRRLNLCLLAGLTLLVGVFTCHPMFEKGADNQLLESVFLGYAEEEHRYPAVCTRTEQYSGDQIPTAAEANVDEGRDEIPAVAGLYEAVDRYEGKWLEYLELPVVERQQYYSLPKSKAVSCLTGKTLLLEPGHLRGLEEHITLTKGDGFSASADEENGESDKDYEIGWSDSQGIPCIVSEQLMDSGGLVLGEEWKLSTYADGAQSEVTLVVSGFFAMRDEEDPYWYREAGDFSRTVFFSEDGFGELLAACGAEQIFSEDHLLLDYTRITWENADLCADYLAQFRSLDSSFETDMIALLASYRKQSRNVSMLMWVLELPCTVLLLLFIYMVAERIAAVEEREFAILVSRGASRSQILEVNLLRWLLLGVFGLGFGILAGAGLCGLAAGTDAFLHFSGTSAGYPMNLWMFPYGLAACVLAAAIGMLPVLGRSRRTVSERTGRSYRTQKRPFWERAFLDMLLLVLSLYLRYNFGRQSGYLAEQALLAESPDPLIFLNVMLFLFASGLLAVRLIRWLVLAVRRIGEKRWSPGIYASFLQMGRTFYRQSLIVVLMAVTIAEGMFDAGMARTADENGSARIVYDVGCDLRVVQEWGDAEPDYGIYGKLAEEGLCEQTTRVFIDRQVSIKKGNYEEKDCILYAIHTKEFGETARLMDSSSPLLRISSSGRTSADGVNSEHWFYALNALAQDLDGAIISRNLADKYGLEVGQQLVYVRDTGKTEQEEIKTAAVEICAIVDGFPGYGQYVYRESEDGELRQEEKYLIVVNYAKEVEVYGVEPYEVWIRLAAGTAEDRNAPGPAAERNATGTVEERNATGTAAERNASRVDTEQMAERVDAERRTEYASRADTEQTAGRVVERLSSAGVRLRSVTVCEELVRENRRSAVIQITNGLFTIGFLISLLVCCVGFLVYQATSMESRKPLFGIYRAMGMHTGELAWMLLHEQIFGTAPAILSGLLTGAIAMKLFIPLLAVVYLPRKHNVPLGLSVEWADTVWLAATVLVFVVICLCILRARLSRLRLADAIKLGEDE